MSEKQLDLFEAEHDVDSWSFGLVKLSNGDLVLAEIAWDENDRPLMWSEPSLVWDSEAPSLQVIRDIMVVAYDIQADPEPIPESEFYTKSNSRSRV